MLHVAWLLANYDNKHILINILLNTLIYDLENSEHLNVPHTHGLHRALGGHHVYLKFKVFLNSKVGHEGQKYPP